MLGRLGPVVVCALLGAGVVLAQNSIQLWEGNPQNCRIDQFDRSVRITGPGAFKLQARVFGGMPGEISKLWIDPNQPVTGAVEVWIVRNPIEVGGSQHEPGAAQVKQIDLRWASGGGVVRELRITSHLAADAPVYATGLDTCAIGGSVLRDVVVAGAVSGPLTVNGFLKANLSCASLDNLTIAGNGLNVSPPPNITIGSSYRSIMNVNQTVNTLTISGDVDPNASVTLAGYSSLYNLAMPSGTLRGTVSVGDVLRRADLAGIAQGGTLSAAVQIGWGAGDYLHVRGDVAGTLTLPYLRTAVQIDGSVTGTGAVTVNQELDAAGFADAVIGAVDAGGTISIGTLTGNLAFTNAMAGSLQVVDELSGTLEFGTTGTGSVQIGTLAGQVNAVGELDGTLTVNAVPSSGGISAGGGISAAIQVETDMAGTIETATGTDLRGSVAILEDLTGEIVIGRDLHGPGDPNDPNAALLGHVIVNGSFQGTPGDPARIVIGGEMSGSHPFIAVDYSGYSGAAWDPSTAVVWLRWLDQVHEPLEINGNAPDYSVWHISGCRGDCDGDRALLLADCDAFVEAWQTPASYAHDYPGLGALQEPWTDGGSRRWHLDTNASGEQQELDLNAFMIRLADPNGPACYATWPGGEPNEVPAQTAEETGRQLLANVDVSRWDGLLVIEEGLTVDNLPEQVREYWAAARGFQTTLYVDPPALDFGDEFLSSEILTLALNDADCENLDYQIYIAKPCATDPNWLTISPSSGQFSQQAAITVTATRSPWPTGDYTVDLVVYIGNNPEPDFLIPVTMSKPLTDPPIMAWVEVDPQAPNELDYVIAGLLEWQRVTDTACLLQVPDPNWFPTIHAALINESGRDMHIFGALKTSAFLTDRSRSLDDPAGWLEISQEAQRIVCATGETTVLFDDETAVDAYQQGPYDPNWLNWVDFRTGLGYLQNPNCDPNCLNPNSCLDPNVTIIWYRGVIIPGYYPCEDDPNMLRSKDLCSHQCSVVGPRVVSLSYDSRACMNQNQNGCMLAARAWEIEHCGAASLFPIIYIGDSGWPATYWTCDEAPTALGELAGDERQDAIFYPGRAYWVETGADVANRLWPEP